MADRFYSEGSSRNNETPKEPTPGPTNEYYTQKKGALGDFSVNIDSNTSTNAPGVVTPSPKAQKFQLHIDNFDDFVTESAPAHSQRPQRNAPVQKKTQSAPTRRAPAQKPQQKKPLQTQKKAIRQSSVEQTQVIAAQKPTKKAQNPVSTTQQTSARKPLTAEQKAKIKARKRYNFIKGVLITCVCVIFITILTVGASTVALNTINDILVIDKGTSRSVRVDIPEGAEYEDVFNILNENGLIKQSFFADFFLRFRHYDTVSYEPGAYYLQSDMGIENLIESIMVKKTINKDTVRLTFPEGFTIAEIFQKIEKYEVCTAEKLYANLDIVAEQYDFIEKIGDVSGRYLLAEGYLFPDTYDFYIDESASSVIKKLFNNFDNKWTEEYSERAKELGMSMDEIINIASMIQAEAKNASQMKDVSSVLHNRLAKKDTYPTLDMNSTKDYITSTNEFGVFTDFYYDLYVGTYNTYTAKGLPPGPICSPGVKAIEAALYPNDTDYYFFCHSSTGDIYLAKTADEHLVNVQNVIL